METDKIPMPDPIWTSRRTELLEWLKRNSPSLVSIYEGAVYMLHNKAVPARHTYIATSVRDIINILPQAIGVGRLHERIKYEKHVKNIAKSWPRVSLSEPAKDVDLDGSASIPQRAYIKIDNLIREHRDQPNQKSRVEHFLRGLLKRKSLDSNVPMAHLKSAMNEVNRWFAQWDHVSHKIKQVPPDAAIEEHFVTFEDTLLLIVGHFTSGTAELDAILQATNAK